MQSQKFSELNQNAQTEIVTKLGALLTECGLADVSVDINRETVCPMAATEVTDTVTLEVKSQVSMDKKEAADKFMAAYKDILKDVDESSYTVSIAACPKVGDKYATIEKVNTMEDGTETNLEHVSGQVWLIDFWATWCPPCQRPMAHNQDMLDKNAEAWKDKIRIIGVSIDKDRETLKKHVEDKKWTSVEHFHRAGSNCSDVYQVRGVPHVMLVDTEGKIVFKGHPANRPDLEQDMKDLAEGKALSGVEAEGKAAAAGGAPEGFKSGLDGEKINSEIDEFKEVAKVMQADETLKTHAKNLPRAFCVMVYQQKYQNGEFLSKFENYRVLMGPQADIDALKTAFSEKVKGSFEVVLRERAM